MMTASDKYRMAAKAVLYLHGFFVILLLVGTPAQFVFPGYTKVQIGLILYAGLAQILFLGKCPLTVLENFFLGKIDSGERYYGSCIRHYLKVWGIRAPRGFTTMSMVFILTLSIVSLCIK